MTLLRRLALGVCACACLGRAQTQQAFPNSYPLPNDGAFGTSLNRLAKITGAGKAVILSKGDRTGIIGLVVSNAGKSGNAAIASSGIAACQFDGTAQTGDYVGSSSVVAGDCNDIGAIYPSSGQVIGRYVDVTHTGSGLGLVALFSPEIRGTAASNGGLSANAISILNIPFSALVPTDGQAWVYSAAHNDLEPVATQFWRKFNIQFSQFAGSSGNSATINLFPRSSRQKVCGITFYTVSAFAAPGLTDVLLAIGDSISTVTFYTTNPVSLFTSGESDYNVMGSAIGSSFVQATIVSSGANLADLTAGSTDIEVCSVTQP